MQGQSAAGPENLEMGFTFAIREDKIYAGEATGRMCLRTENVGKGFAVLNGFNLGRY